jgi:hypothetical protein
MGCRLQGSGQGETLSEWLIRPLVAFGRMSAHQAGIMPALLRSGNQWGTQQHDTDDTA